MKTFTGIRGKRTQEKENFTKRRGNRQGMQNIAGFIFLYHIIYTSVSAPLTRRLTLQALPKFLTQKHKHTYTHTHFVFLILDEHTGGDVQTM